MRKTKKYLAGIRAIRVNELGIKLTLPNNKLYDALNEKKYFWDSASGQWEYSENVPSSSIFAGADGLPSDYFRLRLMTHPDNMPRLIQSLSSLDGVTVLDVSQEYQNRHGAGVRVYVTGKLS